MRNQNQCQSGLIYNGLSVIYIHAFSLKPPYIFNDKHSNVSLNKDTVDGQIFNLNNKNDSALITRYSLKGFSVKIQLEGDKEIKGYVYVEASVYFHNTVCISYHLVIDSKKELNWNENKFCTSSKPLNTDDLIALAGVPLTTEHWSLNDQTQCTEIENDVTLIKINDLFVDEGGNWLNESSNCNGKSNVFSDVFESYKKLFVKGNIDQSYDLKYVFIDIWENIGHSKGLNFGKLKEEEIIEHIELNHQSELIGLLTLYPYEWPYRMNSEFKEICGDNIAIDTDDLILLNQNICVVFGTYGLRGKNSPTDWKEHLMERAKYHVSWPEYLSILEMVLAKKQVVSNALTSYLSKVASGSRRKNIRKQIEEHASQTLNISDNLLKLDTIRLSRFVSHKIMYERTEKRLGLVKDYQHLQEAMDRIVQSMDNITNSREIRQANLLSIVLGIISVASLFSILLTPAEIPFFKSIFANENLAQSGGKSIIILTLLIIIFVIIWAVSRFVLNLTKRIK